MHTLGPWSLEKRSEKSWEVWSQVTDGLIVAVTFGDSPSEVEGHAHLIAAAPELLEACEKLLEWVNNLEYHIETEVLLHAMPNNFGRQVAVRVINKAKGAPHADRT